MIPSLRLPEHVEALCSWSLATATASLSCTCCRHFHPPSRYHMHLLPPLPPSFSLSNMRAHLLLSLILAIVASPTHPSHTLSLHRFFIPGSDTHGHWLRG